MSRYAELSEKLAAYRPTDEWGDRVHHTICDEAAQAIRTLTKERDMAVEALRAFAAALDEWGDDKGQPDRWDVYEHPIAQCVKLGAFRHARSTLTQLEASKGEG